MGATDGREADEIEVTPAMIEAGVTAIMRNYLDLVADLEVATPSPETISEVYRAMVLARPKSSPPDF